MDLTPRPNPPSSESFQNGRRLFCSALGSVHVVAALSLLFQVCGLLGKNGIQPATDFLKAARTELGLSAFFKIPTLCWISDSDGTLATLCVLQAGAGLLMLLGRAPGPAALTAWTVFLSLCSVGSPFLDFQWDGLLLETSLLAVFYLPWKALPRWNEESDIQRIARWLLWWLIFRLLLLSGVVKLSSGDPEWRNLTALCHHFETQPLPIWTAFYIHKLHPLLLKAGVVAMFTIELIVPFGFFIRRWRTWAVLAAALLQAALILSGNFAYFNWLTLALCAPLVPDTSWSQLSPKFLKLQSRKTLSHPILLAGFCALALLAMLVTGLQTLSAFLPRSHQQTLALSASRLLAPLRSFNSYGLFARMTIRRPEIVLEGSSDGVVWRGYRFKWKIEDPWKRPELVAPFHPRLDWQLWFAALGSVRDSPWFVHFVQRLLQGSPDVLSLLAENPFAEKPPVWIRARLYEYHFAPSGSAWWVREERGLFCPPVRLPPPNQ
jgi:hypothetical protein